MTDWPGNLVNTTSIAATRYLPFRDSSVSAQARRILAIWL